MLLRERGLGVEGKGVGMGMGKKGTSGVGEKDIYLSAGRPKTGTIR